MFDVPAHLHGVACDLQQRLDRIQAQASNNDYRLLIDGEALRFPDRIYADATRLERLASSLPGDHRLLCLCLATRHPDGFLRQRAVEALGQASVPWVLAFHLGPRERRLLRTVYAACRKLLECLPPAAASSAAHVSRPPLAAGDTQRQPRGLIGHPMHRPRATDANDSLLL